MPFPHLPGGLLDYDAMLQGLDTGHIGGLGLDVQWQEPFDPSDPLATHPRVVLTPHVAGVTHPSYRSMAQVVAHRVQQVMEGMVPDGVVNHPSAPRVLQQR